MNRFETFKSIYDLKSLLKSVLTTDYISYSTTIGDDKFTFNEETGEVHVRKVTSVRSFFSLYFPNLKIGDIVECECEVRSISGAKPKITIDETFSTILDGDADKKVYMARVQSVGKQGEWETMKLKYIHKGLTYNNIRATFGLWTHDGAGEFMIRNMRAKVLHQTNPVPNYNIQIFVIRKTSTGWEIREDFASNGARLSFYDEQTLSIEFDVRFQNRPLAIAGGEYFQSSYKYRPVCSFTDSRRTLVRLLQSDNSVATLSAVETGTHFNLIVVGF